VLLSIALACAVEMLPGVPGVPLTLAGLWLMFGAPVAVWRGTASRVVSSRDGNLLVAAGLAVVTDILVALAVNTVLPLLGQHHPLTRIPLAGATALVLIAVGTFVPEEPREQRTGGPGRRHRRRPGLAAVLGLGAAALVLSVAGPVRLNNGLGGTVSTVALVAVGALLVLLLARRRRWSIPVLETGLFLASAALLLLNSLRGWYVTGHDIQWEYEFFRLTLGGSLWDVHSYPNAYNACLSITILPVSVVRMTGIPDVYVFKAVLPLLFALVPVQVFRSVHNVAPRMVALLSAVYFVVFPTFFTDMTFLGRQEVAFLLLGGVAVMLTDSGRPLRARRAVTAVLMVGMVLSHYSTTYVVVATFGIAFAVHLLLRLKDRVRRRERPARAGGPPLVTWWLVLLPAVLALVWAGPVTHTSGELRQTVTGAVHELLHPGQAHSGSSDTSYSLFGGGSTSPAQRLAEYRAETLRERAALPPSADLVPLKTADAVRVTAVRTPNQPLTALGRLLGSTGLSVTGLNGVLRTGAAALLQLLLLVGFVVAVRGRRSAFRPTRDQIALAVGAAGLIGLLVLLPQLSVDYSLLRAFQQGLFFFAPFMAAATLWALRWARRRTAPLVCVLVAALFLDLTGVLPKVLGGYPAQLQLSDSGQYYDVYYPDLAEREAAYWLSQRTSATSPRLLQTDEFTFARLQTLITGPAVGGLYPTLLREDTTVLLGRTAVQQGRISVFYQGDLITFTLPAGLLDATKNKVYSSEGAEIYQ
jgi:uncharacterized membrane protein